MRNMLSGYCLVAINNAIVGRMYLSLKIDCDGAEYWVWSTLKGNALIFDMANARKFISHMCPDAELVTYEHERELTCVKSLSRVTK